MAVISAEEFFAVLEKSRLLTPSQLEEARSESGKTNDPATIARSLVRQQRITRWQAGQLLAGRSSFYLGKYRLIELLGRGGMGSVFLAEHMTMNRHVALKIISRQVSKDPASLERFLAEARAIAALDHPNIVRAYSVDNEADRYYLVMEYVEGLDLQRLVETEGPLDCSRAVDYIRQAADGLDHAHQRNMIHCDVKPSNLLVNMQGVVKILDLGLARLADDDKPEKPDGVLGSVDYLSPEQALQNPNLDCRADIYSLGCTFYFLLAGHPPFPTGTLAQRILKHQTQEPPDLREINPKIPAPLALLCQKMMAKEPADRYQTAAEVSRALAAWHTTSPVIVRALPLPIAKPLDSYDDHGMTPGGFSLPASPSSGLLDLMNELPLTDGAALDETALPAMASYTANKKQQYFLAGLIGIGVLSCLCLIVAIVVSHQYSEKTPKPTPTDKPTPTTTPKPIETHSQQPASEAPPAEPPKTEEPPKPVEPAKPQPEPPKEQTAVKPPPETPAVEPVKPASEPPKIPPLTELPGTVSLPKLPAAGMPVTSENSISIGKLGIKPTQVQIALIGGTEVVVGFRGFELEKEIGSVFWTVILTSESRGMISPTRHKVAKLSAEGEELRFSWFPGAATLPAGYLRNCGLRISADKASRFIALRQAQSTEALVLDWDIRNLHQSLTIEDLPETGCTYLQITGFSGSFRECTISPNDTIGPKGKLDVSILSLPILKPTLHIAFELKSPTATIDAVLMWQPPGQNRLIPFQAKDGERAAMQLVAARNQLEESLKNISADDPKRPFAQQELEKKTAVFEQMTALAKFYKESHKAAKLHFRVFNQFKDGQVDLFVTPSPTLKPRIENIAPQE